MKTILSSKGNRLAAAITCAPLALWLLTGCNTAGYQKGDTAAASLRDAAAEVQTESRDLEYCLATLRNLVNTPQGDLKVQYKRFTKALAQVEASAAKNNKIATQVAQKNAAYFQAWNNQLTNMNYEAVRNISEARKAEVSTRFDAVNKRYEEARTAMDPVLSYLNDIRKALAVDLTTGGLTSVRPLVQNAEANSAKVQTALARLTTELNNSSSQLASVSFQTPGVVGTNANTARR